MGDRENTEHDNQQSQQDANSPLPPSGARPTSDANQPHGDNVQNTAQSDLQITEPWFRNPDWYMVLLTALLLIVGAVTLYIFNGQFREMQKQTTILSDQAESAGDDARTANRHAREQLRTMQTQVAAIQRQMRQDQRAWMTNVVETFTLPEPLPPGGFPETGKPFLIRVSFKNIGKSPALNVKSCAREAFLISGEIPNFKCLKKDYRTSGTVFPGPHGTFTDIILTTTFLELDRQKIMSDKWNVWVYGQVTYDDVFGIHHWFDYCSHLLSGGAYAVCKQHTGIDHNE